MLFGAFHYKRPRESFMENPWLFPLTCPTAAIDANESAVTWCVAYWCERGSLPLSWLCSVCLLGNVGFISRSGSVTLIKGAWFEKWPTGEVVGWGVGSQGGGTKSEISDQARGFAKVQSRNSQRYNLSPPLFAPHVKTHIPARSHFL